MTTVKSMAGNQACWEINGCGYRPGSGVDTSYGMLFETYGILFTLVLTYLSLPH